MRVVDVSFFYDEQATAPELLLEQHYTITGWAEALLQQGVEISVLKRFSKESSFKKNNVQHYFVADGFGGMIKPWQWPLRLIRRIKKCKPDVVHVHGFMFPVQVLLLRLLLDKRTSIIVQHHGGNPPKGVRGYLYNWMNNMADGFFFTTNEQGKAWFGKRQLYKIMPVMEGANHFSYCNRDIAREVTKLVGHPIFLWVGRLDYNKDPITVLDGFEKVLASHPTASLYMVYNDDELLDDVKTKINHSTTLKQAVHLLGHIPHTALQDYYNSADYFVLGSHYEGSGYALSEALACGCIPIVTDIPSFCMMTDSGRLGALWQTGNWQSFVDAAAIAIKKDIAKESRNCIDFFKTSLSFEAIARTAIKHYQKAIDSHL